MTRNEVRNERKKNDGAEESNTRKGRKPANIAKSNRDPLNGVTNGKLRQTDTQTDR